MLVKFNSDWAPHYRRGDVLDLPDRIAAHFCDRCIAVALRPDEAATYMDTKKGEKPNENRAVHQE
jgi:hypothetical protein